MSKVLVIAPHPDDETLGCGGALLEHKASGDEIHWIIMTTPGTGLYTASFIRTYNSQVEAVAELFGFESVYRMGFPASELDTLNMGAVLRALAQGISAVNPQVVYIPSLTDAHGDHQVTHRAAMALLKPQYMAGYNVSRIMACETISETNCGPVQGFRPNVWVNTTASHDRKMSIYKVYETENKLPARGLRAVEALAAFRGSQIGAHHAEAFELIREIR